jgi:hypothetical protein
MVGSIFGASSWLPSNALDQRLMKNLSFSLAVAAVVVGSGCSDGDFPVAPVTGVVTLDGAPLPGGQIRFAPVNANEAGLTGKAGFGVIGSDGAYELATFGEDDGAIIGKHWVTIYGHNPRAPKDSASLPKFGKFSVPAQQEVKERDNKIDIAITTDELRKFGTPPKPRD